MSTGSPLQTGIVARTLNRFVDRVLGILPELVGGLVFLLVAALGIRVVRWLLRRVLRRARYGDSPVYRQFVVTVVTVFLWFGAALAFLSIVGLDGIAVSLGTATGFVALGVSYALSGMIADVVAGVYLLRDPDFDPGDLVTVGDMTAEVRSIELRKTRFEEDGDVVVVANADIEERWRKEVEGAD